MKKILMIFVVIIFLVAFGYTGLYLYVNRSIEYPEVTYNVKENKTTVIDDFRNIYAFDDSYVYLNYYYDDTIILSNSRGVVIYDLKSEKIKNTVDLQKISCNYFGDTYNATCILKENNNLIVFNIKTENEYTEFNGKPFGSYYVFDLNSNSTELKCIDNGNDKKKLSEYYNSFKKYWSSNTSPVEDVIGDDGRTYSENIINIKEGKKKFTACLYTDYDNIFYLEKSNRKKDCKLNIPDPETENIPEYEYKDDEKLNTIVRYFSTREELYDNEVLIPAFNVYGESEENGEHLIFGDFFFIVYKKVGNTLYPGSAGSFPGCFHLIKKGKEYKVKTFDEVVNGEDYEDSKNEILSGHPFIKFIWSVKEKKEDFHRQEERYNIQNYVMNNDMPIKYYIEGGYGSIGIKEVFD